MIMAPSITHYLLNFVVIAIFCVSRINFVSAKSKLFIFGDSLFDAGNFGYVFKTPRQWPYGISYPNISRGRASDGLMVPDFIALSMNLPLMPAYLKPGSNFSDGANLAVGASAILDRSNPKNVNLKGQIANFKKVLASLKQKVGEAKAKEEMMTSIFLFSFGGVDYNYFQKTFPLQTELQAKNFRTAVIGKFMDGITELYNAGGRKFAFQNVGPWGCYPVVKANFKIGKNQCYEKPNKLMIAHNQAFLAAIKQLQNQLPQLQYSVFDFYTVVRDRILNPTKYGFKVGDVACCGTGTNGGNNCGGSGTKLCANVNEYLYFDGNHNTQSANQQLAQLFWSGGPEVVTPINLSQLLVRTPNSFESLLESVTEDLRILIMSRLNPDPANVIA